MEVAIVDEFLKPGPVNSLVRLGRNYDGGYLVDERSVASAEILLAMGINNDWSFERDFRKANPCPMFAFDGTVSKRKFAKDVIRSIPRLDKPQNFFNNVRTLLEYSRFFANSARHIEVLVGMDRHPRFMSLKSIFESYVPGNVRHAFLKIDIEGWEYRVLDDLADVSDRICGIVIEFHDFDLHRDRVRAFLKRTNLKVCHVHCNNYGLLNASGTPLVLEVSLTKFDVDGAASPRLPHTLDMPNNESEEDYRIEFR